MNSVSKLSFNTIWINLTILWAKLIIKSMESMEWSGVGVGMELQILNFSDYWNSLNDEKVRSLCVENKKLRLWVYIFVGTLTLFGVNIFFCYQKLYLRNKE